VDVRFRPAEEALTAGDVERATALLAAEPDLATARSTRSHPNLMQCLVLVNPPHDALEPLIHLLADYGSELTGPLIAATCIDNVRGMNVLLDLGADIEGDGRWSPLEEALYWGFDRAVKLLLERGAKIDNLRKAAALGRLDVLTDCFDRNGRPRPSAGLIASPFEGIDARLSDEVRHDPRQIIDNALVYAAGWGQTASMQELLKRGAEINAIPAGFDFAGTPLHYAALRGRRDTVDWLLVRGADPSIRDPKVNNMPEDWAAHDRHSELAAYLRERRECAS
jgi:ankyrin repeat protein